MNTSWELTILIWVFPHIPEVADLLKQRASRVLYLTWLHAAYNKVVTLATRRLVELSRLCSLVLAVPMVGGLLACLAPLALMPPGPLATSRLVRPNLRMSDGSPGIVERLRDPQFGIVTGSALLLALVANRLGTDELLNSQSRADLIATIGPVLLTLDALNNLDITPREAEEVQLTGAAVDWTDPSIGGETQRELQWAADTLGERLGSSSLAVWLSSGPTIAARGLLSRSAAAAPASTVRPGPLLEKCAQSTTGAPEYLPALQLLPGRVEFSYFPEETQALLMVPLGGQIGAIVLGANRKRAFGSDDVMWARAIATRLGAALAEQ